MDEALKLTWEVIKTAFFGCSVFVGMMVTALCIATWLGW